MGRDKALGLALLLGSAFLVPALGEEPPDKPGHVFLADTTGFRVENGLRVVFTNGADEPVGVVFSCFTWLQGQNDSHWVDLFTPDCSHVRVFPQPVQPGETIEDLFPLEGIDLATLNGWAELRLRSTLHRPEGPDEEIFSAPFVLPVN